MLRDWLNRLLLWWTGAKPPATAATLEPLECVVLTDGVTRTLFDGYGDHRRSSRGGEEIGWVLLGHRRGNRVVALAALPAGMERDAGAAHVRFNPDVQELATHVLRQADRMLTVVGIVHTHPGDLRQPSGGDFDGDRLWVQRLKSGDAVFAIGTADGHAASSAHHEQRVGDLRFSWYALARGDRRYRPLPFQVAAGVDLASPLHAIWDLLEQHARPLIRLYRQLAKVEGRVIEENTLSLRIALPEPAQQLHVLLTDSAARYYWERDGVLSAVDPGVPQIDRAVLLILAELAQTPVAAEAETLVAP